MLPTLLTSAAIDFLSLLLGAIILVLIHSRDSLDHLRALVGLIAGGMIWGGSNGLALILSPLPLKLFWSHFSYVGVCAVPACWLLFSLQYLGDHPAFRRPLAWLLTIEPVLVLVAVWTNPSHLFYTSTTVYAVSQLAVLRFKYGPLFWANVAYSYGLIVIGAGIMLYRLRKSPPTTRTQGWLLLSAIALPMVTNVLYIATPLFPADASALAFPLSALLLVRSLSRYHLQDIVPIARQELVEQISAPFLVLDQEKKLVDFNPAAARMFSLTTASMGLHIEEVFHSERDLLGAFGSADRPPTKHTRIQRGTQWLEVNADPLADSRQHPLGTLYTIEDITSNQEAQNELARLYQSADEQRRLALALGKAMVSMAGTLDLDQLFDRLLQALAPTLPFDAATLLILDGDQARIARHRGYENYGVDVLESLRDFRLPVSKAKNLREMTETHQPFVLPDGGDDPSWIPVPLLPTPKSWVGAPVIVDDKVTGFLSLDRMGGQRYTYEDAHTLALFASQVSLALRNAKLYAEVKQAYDREKIINQVANTLNSAPELPMDKLFESALRLASEALGAEGGLISLSDQEGEALGLPFAYNLPNPNMRVIPAQGVGVSFEVFKTGKPVILSHYAHHPWAIPSWVESSVESFLAAPLTAADERIGVIALFTTDKNKHFAERDLALATALGQQIGLALQNRNLLQKARQQARDAEALRAATAGLIAAIEPAQVTSAIFRNLRKLVPYDHAGIFVRGDEGLSLAASQPQRMLPQNLRPQVTADALPFLPQLEAGETIYLDGQQLRNLPAEFLLSPQSFAWLGTPLVWRNQFIGLISMETPRPEVFTEHARAMTQILANTAAMAIQNARLYSEQQRLAITDSLTGLYNHRHFTELATLELARSTRYGHPVSLLMLDADDLKEVNDTYGHLGGDALLIEIADILRRTLRSTDIYARYAGDEFIAMLTETYPSEAENVSARLLAASRQALASWNGLQIPVSISIGLAHQSLDPYSLDSLIEQADQALYEAKRLGKGRLAIHTYEIE